MTPEKYKAIWNDYISELSKIKWNIDYGTPDYERITEIVKELKEIVDRVSEKEEKVVI